MKRAKMLLLALALLAANLLAPTAVRADPGQDYAIRAGRFYTQTAADPAAHRGYALTDEGGIPFFSEFQTMGGTDVLGYPVSRRYPCGGFVCQALQRSILQWRPELGRAALLNVFDEMSSAGLDKWLLVARQIPPPFDTAPDSGLSWDLVMARHLAILDRDPAIRDTYWAAANALQTYGLPTSYADLGNVSVVRAQRAAFQRWKVNTPWARAGEITLANCGDIAKESGLIPQSAILPEDAPVAELTPTPAGPRLEVALPSPKVAQVVNASRPAVPQIITQEAGPNGAPVVGFGSGVIFDPRGYLLTNYHVVEGAQSLVVVLTDGRRLPGTVVGISPIDDLAVVRVSATGLPALPLGDSDQVQVGEPVVGLGYGVLLPVEPNARVGTVISVSPVVPGVGQLHPFDTIQTDVPLIPGDSGGPLLNLEGRVVGLDEGRVISHRGRVEFRGLSIPINRARPLLERLGLEARLPATGA